MDQPAVAPYGGFIVKSLDDEKANQAELEKQSIEVDVDGQTQQLRPEAIRLNGVDNLSTEEIKAYVEYYLNYTSSVDSETGKISYAQKPFQEQITFRVEWIDDSNVCIVFKTSDENRKALEVLREDPITTSPEDPSYVNAIIQEQKAKPYDPIIAFRKAQSMSVRLGLVDESLENKESSGDMDEDQSSIELIIRQAFQLDRKVKNASQYSRYYLIHGEPERQPRRRRQPHHNSRPRHAKQQQEDAEEEDLFAEKLNSTRQRSSSRNNGTGEEEDEDLFKDLKSRRSRRDVDDEEDLFADKLRRTRSRSPTR